jgi:hypothetical protein
MALDHLVAPVVARDDEGSEVAAAEAKRGERHHYDDLQHQLAHDRYWKKGRQCLFLIGQTLTAARSASHPATISDRDYSGHRHKKEPQAEYALGVGRSLLPHLGF